jgi:hypothetical protein
MSMETVPSFYVWIRNITNIDEDRLMTAYNLFDIHNGLDLDFINNLVIENKTIDKKALKEFLENEGFINV